MGIRGVWDVETVIMTAHRDDGLIVENENENVEIYAEEEAEPRTINISYEIRE